MDGRKQEGKEGWKDGRNEVRAWRYRGDWDGMGGHDDAGASSMFSLLIPDPDPDLTHEWKRKCVDTAVFSS